MDQVGFCSLWMGRKAKMVLELLEAIPNHSERGSASTLGWVPSFLPDWGHLGILDAPSLCVIKQSSSASGQLGLRGKHQGALWEKLWSPPGPLTCYPRGQIKCMRRTFYHITSPTLFSSISHLFLSLQTSTTSPSPLWMTSLLISLSN